MLRATTILILAGVTAAGAAGDELDRWPPRDYLIRSLVEGIPAILNSYDPETGRFGGGLWNNRDQNRIYPLAAAWSIEHPDNPYYRSEEVLEAVGKGGVALVEAQDEAGRWRYDKKDGSYWGQDHTPWTYSRWIRAYDLVGDALPDDVRETWERGMTLGFRVMSQYFPDARVHNKPAHRAMALYIAGEVLGNDDWRQRASRFMAKVVEAQDPGGFWSEHVGPVVGYNFVYSESLGLYYHYARDPVVLDALARAARFHAAILWPDGSSVACIDNRSVHSGEIRIGNAGFSHTPEGRGYLLAQIARYARDETGRPARLLRPDAAADLLLYAAEGEVVMPDEIGEDGVSMLGDSDALVRRGDPWSWALSAYTAEVSASRWIYDRQNLLELFHADLGLVAGGGNTKAQPMWSTFTLGDTSLLNPTFGAEEPNFTPEIDLAWTPLRASVSHLADRSRLQATMTPPTRRERERLLRQVFADVAVSELPAAWRLSHGDREQMRVTRDEAREAGQSLWFRDDDETRPVGLRSPRVPAGPDEEYYVEGWWLGEPGNHARIYIEFWDEEGRLDDGVRSFSLTGDGQWRRGGGSLRAPAGTVAVTMLAYSISTAKTEGYFDCLELGRLVQHDRTAETVECVAEIRTDGDDLLLTYRAPQGVGVQAHLPLMFRGTRLESGTGELLTLGDEPLEMTAEQAGGRVSYNGLLVPIPEGATLRWPARQFNPYTADGSASLNSAKLTLVMPFERTDEYSLRLRATEPDRFEELVFDARELPVEHSDGAYTKTLENLGSQLLGGSEVGDWLRFTLPEVEPGRYELLGDFVLAHSYGIVDVLLDGEVVGEPFDGYWEGVWTEGALQSFGAVEVGAGPHEVTVRVAGRNPAATGQIFSVKLWLLRPLD